MNITRNIVLDLWPVYRSGEASADTRVLIEEYLASDPGFAASMEKSDVAIPAPAFVVAPAPDTARALFSKTKTLLRRRTLFVALAIVLLAIPPAIRSMRMTFPAVGTTLFGATPWPWENAISLACIAASAGFWIGYAAVRRRLRVRGF